MNADVLYGMKKAIEQKKAEKAKLEGRRDQLMEQLKDLYGCSTLEEASALCDVKEAELKSKEAELGKIEKELREKYGNFLF